MWLTHPLALAAALALAATACDTAPPAAPVADAAGPVATDSLAADSLAVDSVEAVALPPDTVDVRGVQTARARIEPAGDGSVSGTLRLARVAGGVRVLIALDGLSSSGFHAVQILRGRDCDAEPAVHLGVDAGTPHGGPYSLPGLRHAGDLGSIRGDGGDGRYDRIDAALSLDGTMSPVGRAVVVRAERDDGASADGAAGDVVGCGVIERGR
ncbi:superoxide dismutase family protein [Rubrivirga sp.]|uniref:superoxide dismutase family protein n=1 Tax=Rubrivirga sp. TaxID=1885344 RepID=UPI003B52B517